MTLLVLLRGRPDGWQLTQMEGALPRRSLGMRVTLLCTRGMAPAGGRCDACSARGTSRTHMAGLVNRSPVGGREDEGSRAICYALRSAARRCCQQRRRKFAQHGVRFLLARRICHAGFPGILRQVRASSSVPGSRCSMPLIFGFVGGVLAFRRFVVHLLMGLASRVRHSSCGIRGGGSSLLVNCLLLQADCDR